MKNKIVIGTAYFGTRINRERSFALLDCFTDSGGKTVDTANSYADWEKGGRGGDSERIIGSWLKNRGKRESVEIISKVGYEYSSVRRGLYPDTIVDECNKSLKNLQTDYIDLYLAHLDDRTCNLETTVATFNKLIDTGKIRTWGLSNYSLNRVMEIVNICNEKGFTLPEALENHYSLIEPADTRTYDNMLWSDLNDDIIKACQKNNVAPLAHSPLLWGAYSRDDRPLWGSFYSGVNTRRVEKVRELSKEIGITPNQLVLSWILNHKAVSPVIGVSSINQLKENLYSSQVVLKSDQINKIEKIRRYK